MTRNLFAELEELKSSALPVAVDDAVTLRPYQEVAVDNVFGEWRGGHRSTLVCMPTGMGKSVVLTSVIERILDRSELN